MSHPEEHSASLAELPEMNPGPVCRLGLDGTVELANAAARRIFGHDDLLGLSWFDVCPAMPPTIWTDVLSGDRTLNFEASLAGHDYTFTIAHQADSEHVFVYGTDISALKKAERLLARGTAELAAMARFPEMNPGPVCRVDRTGEIVLANRAARTLFSDEKLVGKQWVDLCPGMTGQRWAEVLESREAVLLEARVEPRYLVFTHTPGADGRDVFVYGTDLTQQKAAEGALRQSEKMATLGTLAAGVAHELNNPAAAAQRSAGQLADAVAQMQQAHMRFTQAAPSRDEARQQEALGEVARERAAARLEMSGVDRSNREAQVEAWLESHGIAEGWELAPELVSLGMDGHGLDALAECIAPDRLAPAIEWASHAHRVHCLIAEIADGSRRVAAIVGALRSYTYLGQAPVQNVNVNDGLRQTLVVLQSKLKPRVKVVENLAAELPAVHGQGGELNQVWTHLIDNAVQAMDGEGTIQLRSSHRDGRVIVEVEDDGCGIPAEIEPRIFDAFFTTRPPGEGTGLGLNTVYNTIVKNHGGNVSVESRPGRTVFTVSLPLESPRS